jgi:hypothetical protein
MAKSDPPRFSSKPPVPMLGTDTLLFDPEVRKAIGLALMDVGIRDDELVALEADVIAECWQDRLYESDPPDSIARWQEYARPRAKDMGLDVIRKRKSEAERQAAPPVPPPALVTPDAEAEPDDASTMRESDAEGRELERERRKKRLARSTLVAVVVVGVVISLLVVGLWAR